jgi:hypothetical protein
MFKNISTKESACLCFGPLNSITDFNDIRYTDLEIIHFKISELKRWNEDNILTFTDTI